MQSSPITIETTVAIAFDLFLSQPGRAISTRQKFRYKFKKFLLRHGNKTLGEVNGELIEKWFAYLERCSYSDGHLAMHRSCHKTFWRFCSQYTGQNPANTIPTYSETPEQIITANRSDVEAALCACENMVLTIAEQRDAAIFALGSCGLRRSNVQSARFSVMKTTLSHPAATHDDHLYILRVKGKQEMEAIFNERLAKIIRRYMENRPTTDHDRLFINLNPDDDSYLKPLSAEGLIRARRRVCKRAGVPLISFQKMRRLVGTTVARKYGLEIAAQVLGHKSGIEVIRKHYYDPDKEAARLAAFDAISHL